MRKILSMLLALTMILSLFSVNVFAADELEVKFTCDTEIAASWKNLKEIITADEFTAFLAAINTEGAVISVECNTPPKADGSAEYGNAQFKVYDAAGTEDTLVLTDFKAGDFTGEYKMADCKIKDITSVTVNNNNGCIIKKLVVSVPKSATTEPEPDEPTDKYYPFDLPLYINGQTAVTKTITGSGEYTYEFESATEVGDAWAMLKKGPEGQGHDENVLPAGTVIRTTEFVVDGVKCTFDGKEYYDYVVPSDGRVEMMYRNVFAPTETITVDDFTDSGKMFKKLSVTIVVEPEDEKEPEPSKPEVSTECKEEHKGWTIVDVSSYKDMDGNFYIDLPKTGKTGDLMSIHIIGTVTGTDAPRIFIANNGEWDNNFTGSYDHRLTVTDGVINYSADSFVLTAPKAGGDVASRIAFRDVKGLTITHLAYVFVDPTEEDPDAPTVPECTQDHEGWKIVDVTTYKNKSGEFNIPITRNVKAGDTLTVHIIGYATTAGRFYVANDEGSDHDLSGGRANVIDEKVKLDANGVFDYITEPFTLYAPKSGSIVATRFIFKDSKALTITHFAYLVEHPESEPKGYEEDEALTNATVEAEDDSIVVTPDGELKTEGLLVTFDGEGAPAAGTVVVNYVAENGKETKVLDNPDGDAEIISDCKAPNDFFGKGGFWGRAAANALDLTIDEIKALFEVDGAAFTFVYSGTPDGYYGGVPKVNLNGKFDNAALCKLTTLSDGKIQATVKLADVLKASGVEVKDIENFLVQTCVQNFKIYSASFTVPGVASTAPVEFKAGKKYVEVPTDKNKTITSVVVSYEGAEADDIASVKISSGKKTEDVSSKITLNGNAIRLGEDHHGFLYMGHIITLPHTFGDDNVCTICGYKRIVIEPTSKLIETEVKINDDTVNKFDKEVTVADGTATCSDDQFSILLPRAYSIGDEVKIHIKGSSDGDFRIWAADGGTTMSPEPLWKASENGFTSGNFDLEITLTIGDKDNSGKETANAVLFKGAAYGVKLNNFKLTYLAYYVEEEGDYKTSSDALYSLTTTGGQNFENKNLAGGLELETNDGRTRLATSWVGEGKVYDAMVNAFKANPEAVIKITYTGTITAFGIESENAGILDVANEVTEGQKYTVMTVKVADVLDTCKDAIADSSWRNIYVVAEDGAVLYGFEVVPA